MRFISLISRKFSTIVSLHFPCLPGFKAENYSLEFELQLTPAIQLSPYWSLTTDGSWIQYHLPSRAINFRFLHFVAIIKSLQLALLYHLVSFSWASVLPLRLKYSRPGKSPSQANTSEATACPLGSSVLDGVLLKQDTEPWHCIPRLQCWQNLDNIHLQKTGWLKAITDELWRTILRLYSLFIFIIVILLKSYSGNSAIYTFSALSKVAHICLIINVNISIRSMWSSVHDES